MFPIHYSKQYRKSYKRLAKSGDFDSAELEGVIDTLASGKKLPEKYKDHSLSGTLSAYRECHVKPDLVMIYTLTNSNLLVIADVGSHSELFG